MTSDNQQSLCYCHYYLARPHSETQYFQRVLQRQLNGAATAGSFNETMPPRLRPISVDATATSAQGQSNAGTRSKPRRVSLCTNTDIAFPTPLSQSSKIPCIQAAKVPPQFSLCSLSIFSSQASLNHVQSFFCPGESPAPTRANLSSTSNLRFLAAAPPPFALPFPSDSTENRFTACFDSKRFSNSSNSAFRLFKRAFASTICFCTLAAVKDFAFNSAARRRCRKISTSCASRWRASAAATAGLSVQKFRWRRFSLRISFSR